MENEEKEVDNCEIEKKEVIYGHAGDDSIDEDESMEEETCGKSDWYRLLNCSSAFFCCVQFQIFLLMVKTLLCARGSAVRLFPCQVTMS